MCPASSVASWLVLEALSATPTPFWFPFLQRVALWCWSQHVSEKVVVGLALVFLIAIARCPLEVTVRKL